jgi:hypothetical protein
LNAIINYTYKYMHIHIYIYIYIYNTYIYKRIKCNVILLNDDQRKNVYKAKYFRIYLIINIFYIKKNRYGFQFELRQLLNND